MIPLHRITHPDQVVYVNCDLVQTVESTPDTVVSLTNATKLVVRETPDEVLAAIRAWRASIVAAALEAGAGAPEGLAEVVHLASSRGETLGGSH